MHGIGKVIKMGKIKIILLVTILIVSGGIGLYLYLQTEDILPVYHHPAVSKTIPNSIPYTLAMIDSYYQNPELKGSGIEDLLAQIPKDSLPVINKTIKVISMHDPLFPMDDEMRTQSEKIAKQLHVKGYIEADEQEITGFGKLKEKAISMEKINVNFLPSDLSGLGLKFAGAIEHGPMQEEKNTILTRIFTTANGEIHITEWEGHGATLMKEFINEDIKGYPAIYVTKKNSDGTLKELLCFSDKKTYEITTNDSQIDIVTVARLISD